ncbi:uncharacterized protein G2W53_000057 [Senna tora]|uniref:Uncharacterized protein n=1 Tax=Senna tora TaxID=362788 RepID=A0A835CL81_9FABA|nr:uncharacterized protein G2W53_000057 [Senna tora]
MEGGTRVQCFKSDNRVNPSELKAEATYKVVEKHKINNRSFMNRKS